MSDDTINSRLAAMARDRPDVEAVVDGDERLTFAELQEASLRATRGAMASGVESGDRVAFWAPNSVRWVIEALGVLGAGGVVIPINTRLKGPEAADILLRSGATQLFLGSEFLGVDFEAVLSGRIPPSVRQVVTLGSDSHARYLDAGQGVSLEDALARSHAVRADDISDVIFTSGSTGVPKGIVYSHGNSLKAYLAKAQIIGLTPDDRVLVLAPFSSAIGYKSGWMLGIALGYTTILLPVFEVEKAMRVIERERVTSMAATPTMYQYFLDDPSRPDYDLTSLRICLVAGAPVPPRLRERVRAELCEDFAVMFGMTETGPITICRPDESADLVAATVGRLVPGHELRLVDEDGQDAPEDGSGEVWVRSGPFLVEYCGDNGVAMNPFDDDGWLHTGDIGIWEASGNLRLLGRKHDMFIVGGFNVYPAEVESALLRHGDLVDVSVAAKNDERLGEVGIAFAVLRAGSTLTADELLAWIKERIANYKVPRRIVLVDELPVSPNGKVVKTELLVLLDAIDAGNIHDVATPRDKEHVR